MSSAFKKVEAAPATSASFDDIAVKAKIKTIEDNVNKIIGKKGHNPFFWLNEKVYPLVNRYLKNERTSELQAAILALDDEPPKLDIELGMTEAEQRQKYAELQREQSMRPIGLLMPQQQQ